MIRYLLSRTDTRYYYTWADRWTPFADKARTFASISEAEAVAIQCPIDLALLEIVQVTRDQLEAAA